jgi:hypothetical protein
VERVEFRGPNYPSAYSPAAKRRATGQPSQVSACVSVAVGLEAWCLGSYSPMVSLMKPMITAVISSPVALGISFATPLRWDRGPPLHSRFP